MAAHPKAIHRYRSRQKQKGLVRVEVQAPQADVALIRELAQRLRDNSDEAQRLRESLRQQLLPQKPSFKTFLRSEPFVEFEVERQRDLPRALSWDS
jgi:transposase